MPQPRVAAGRPMTPVALACCAALLQANGANGLVLGGQQQVGSSLRLGSRTPTTCEFEFAPWVINKHVTTEQNRKPKPEP